MSAKQRGVIRGVAPAAAATVIGIFGAVWFAPSAFLPADDLYARLAFAMKWDLLVLLSLFLSIGSLARLRFRSPEDIDGSGLSEGSPRARIHQAIIQNTLEQSVLALGIHIACAILLPIGWLAAVPVAAVSFALGRLLFWRGYDRGAPGRALGFGLTFYPSILLGAILIGSLFSFAQFV